MNLLLLYFHHTNYKSIETYNNSYDSIIVKQQLDHYELYVTINGNLEITKYYTPFFNFNLIKDVILRYDFVIYIDNKRAEINSEILDDLIYDSLLIFKNNNDIDQVIFEKIPDCEHIDKNLSGINVSIPVGEINYFKLVKDKWRQFEMCKEIFVNKENSNQKLENPTMIDHTEYATKIFKNICNFSLKPSVIKSSFVVKMNEDVCLKNCNHFEYKYSLELEKQNFKSCYLNKESIKKQTEITKKKDPDDMTIVTGFLDLNIDRKPKRASQAYSYIDKSYPTLSLKQNMVIYVSEETIDHVTKVRTELNLLEKTKIILVTKKNLFMLDKLNAVIECVKKNIVPYDNDYLLLLVNSRYNYMLDATQNNYFNTNYFCWIDFGAGHIVNIPNTTQISYNEQDKIKIAWIARLDGNKSTFKFNHKAFGGGIFVGHKDIMIEYIELHNKLFLELLNDGHVINDDKLLFLMFERYPYIFDTFFSGYEFMAKKI